MNTMLDERTPPKLRAIGKVEIEITDKTVAYLLCSAREGGSNYWAVFDGCPYAHDSKNLLPLRLPVDVYDSEDGSTMTLDMTGIQRAIALLSSPKYARLLSEIMDEYGGDGSTGDEFLQLCLFGEVVYG